MDEYYQQQRQYLDEFGTRLDDLRKKYLPKEPEPQPPRQPTKVVDPLKTVRIILMIFLVGFGFKFLEFVGGFIFKSVELVYVVGEGTDMEVWPSSFDYDDSTDKKLADRPRGQLAPYRRFNRGNLAESISAIFYYVIIFTILVCGLKNVQRARREKSGPPASS